jgi:hypothetical protein
VKPVHRTHLVLAAAAVGIAAALAAGYAAGGRAGLTDAAAVAAVGVLVVARGTVRGGKPGPVRSGQTERATAVSAEDFPAYRSIASDLEWGRLSWRHYQHAVRPLLARLAAALGRRAPADLSPPRPADADGPGPDLATLDRMIAELEERT